MMWRTILGLRAAAIALVLGVIGLANPAPATEPAAKSTTKSCPSLAGKWSGTFAGSAAGSWVAEFTAAGEGITAKARILVLGAGGIEGQGRATLACEKGRVILTGAGSSDGHSADFTGVAHSNGRTLTGTWRAGQIGGTWSGGK